MKDFTQYRPETFDVCPKGWIRNWFSNMVPFDIEVDGVIYNSTENYYQAYKTIDLVERERIALLAPNVSKREGRKLIIRKDWEEIKYDVMKRGLQIKFSHPYWKEKLLATGDEMIIEWNNWKDKVWGVTSKDNKGNNLLGQALMEIRDELRLV